MRIYTWVSNAFLNFSWLWSQVYKRWSSIKPKDWMRNWKLYNLVKCPDSSCCQQNLHSVSFSFHSSNYTRKPKCLHHIFLVFMFLQFRVDYFKCTRHKIHSILFLLWKKIGGGEGGTLWRVSKIRHPSKTIFKGSNHAYNKTNPIPIFLASLEQLWEL